MLFLVWSVDGTAAPPAVTWLAVISLWGVCRCPVIVISSVFVLLI